MRNVIGEDKRIKGGEGEKDKRTRRRKGRKEEREKRRKRGEGENSRTLPFYHCSNTTSTPL
jgi:hypothetical protein